jgi:hypothetical protein
VVKWHKLRDLSAFAFLKQIGVTGFEPAASWTQTRRSNPS